MQTMCGDGSLSFREFVTREPLPLATIHDAVLEFLRGHSDAVLFGAQAVNAYVDESRMTQEVDIMSPRAADFAEELAQHLNDRFHIAVRVRKIGAGRGFRVFQIQKPKDRHLADVRQVKELPPAERVRKVLVVSPGELIAGKVMAYYHRRGTPKSGTDRRDIAMLLLQFPELKAEAGPVRDRLSAAHANSAVLATWHKIVNQDISLANEEDEF
jgi:hypothetical protein